MIIRSELQRIRKGRRVLNAKDTGKKYDEPFIPSAFSIQTELRQESEDGELGLRSRIDFAIRYGRDGEFHCPTGQVPRAGLIAVVELARHIRCVKRVQNRGTTTRESARLQRPYDAVG